MIQILSKNASEHNKPSFAETLHKTHKIITWYFKTPPLS